MKKLKGKRKLIDKDGHLICEWKFLKKEKCRFPFGYCNFWRFCHEDGITDFPFDRDQLRKSDLPIEYIMSPENKKKAEKWFGDG